MDTYKTGLNTLLQTIFTLMENTVDEWLQIKNFPPNGDGAIYVFAVLEGKVQAYVLTVTCFIVMHNDQVTEHTLSQMLYMVHTRILSKVASDIVQTQNTQIPTHTACTYEWCDTSKSVCSLDWKAHIDRYPIIREIWDLHQHLHQLIQKKRGSTLPRIHST